MVGINQMSLPLNDVAKEILFMFILGSIYLTIGEVIYRKRNQLRLRFMQRRI